MHAMRLGLTARVLVGALAAGALVAGCSEYSCIDLACPSRTEIYFADPIREPGEYVIEGTGSRGVPIDCEFSVARSGSGLRIEAFGCAGILPPGRLDAGNPTQLDGFNVEAVITSALLVVRRNGVVVYDGQATLERVEVNARICNCDIPVLVAQ